MADDFGLYSGLAVRGNTSDMIGDMERHDMKMAQNKALAESKAKLFADSVEYQNSANSYDNPIIKKYNDKIIKDMGRYYKENPDLLYNPDKLLKVREMRRGILDNEHSLRAKASDEAFAKMNQYLEEVKKNPELYDQEAMQEYLNQKQEYLKHGNQFGLEASLKEGAKPFVFNPPPKFEPDLAKTLQGLGKGIGQYNIQKNEDGDYWRTPDEESVKALKTEATQRYRRQLQVEAKRAGITDPSSVEKWVENQIKSGFQKEYHVGDPDAKFKKQLAWAQFNEQKRHHGAMEAPKGGGGEGFSSFNETFNNPNRPAGYADPDAIRKVWGTTPKIQMYGKSTGKMYDLTGKDWFPDNRFITSEGQKFLTGHLKLSKEEAEKAGIYKSGALTIDGITDDFLGSASEESMTKDGKTYDYIKVNYQLPINTDDKTAMMRYDASIQPDKTVNVPSVTKKQPFRATKAQFLSNGWTEEQIKEGLQKGKIQVD